MTYNQYPYLFSGLNCYQQCRRNGFRHEICVNACRRPQYKFSETLYYPTASTYESSPSSCELLRNAIEELKRQISYLGYRWNYATTQAEKDEITRQIDELQRNLANAEYQYKWEYCA